MRIIDILSGPWAITSEMLIEIRSIYAKHLRGEKINVKDIEAATGKTLQRKEQGYEVVNRAAIIPIDGVIAKKMNLLMDISGGASTQLIERDIRAALDDPQVDRLILNVDSPGGTVDGTFELADFVFSQRGKKPIIAFTNGMMASAAYAIASAADMVYISGDTTQVGSIGVVTAHEDYSKLEEKFGVKTTEIYSGKYKRIVSQVSPLSDEGRKTLQDEIDYLYSVFVDAVAKHRGATTELVLSAMSTDVKRIFIGKQAIEAGLVDGVATLDQLIDGTAGVAVPNDTTKKEDEQIMTLDELKQKHSDLANALIGEGREAAKAEVSAAVETARKDGAEAERKRIQDVRAQSVPGHENLVESLMFDGKSTAADAAVAILAAEKKIRQTMKENLKRDAAEVPDIPASDPNAAAASETPRATPEEEKVFKMFGIKTKTKQEA